MAAGNSFRNLYIYKGPLRIQIFVLISLELLFLLLACLGNNLLISGYYYVVETMLLYLYACTTLLNLSIKIVFGR